MTDRGGAGLPVRVCVLGDGDTLAFAGSELGERLERITGRKTVVVNQGSCDPSNAICVGLLNRFPGLASPDVADPQMDDAIAVHVTGASGVISGINPRSVLLAVYRYLTELGCRWVRPGKDGEFLPKLAALPDVHLDDRPAYRHRAVCIEGAVSLDHVTDMVDWLPKLGFNGYFIQFREAYTFFDRWYSHVGRPEGKPMSLSKADAAKYTAAVEAEIRKRGLIYHKVGHGWTCEPFGISGMAWEKESGPVPPDVVPYLAEVDGERKLWHGVALNTNLCYSNPEVRRRVVGDIVAYARSHPDIDLLHFWLADGSNNNCECPRCQESRPSDFYVMMLNELDAALTEHGVPTRIVFLIYVDLLWPPSKERIRNPARFVLMFAPIARTYSQTFRATAETPALPAYERNKLKFPRSVEANLAFLKAWQEVFAGDSFDFDYHLMWDHLNDPGHMQIAQTISEDIKGLKDIGLNGFVSCQIQRVFLPTGLAMTVMGKTLWNAQSDFGAITQDYFASAFGPEAVACQEYLTTLSALFDPAYLRGERNGAEKDSVARLAKACDTIRAFMPVMQRNTASTSGCQQASWRYLRDHADLCLDLARAYSAKASGAAEQAAALWQELEEKVWHKEPELHRVLDAWLFTEVLRRRFR